MATSEFARELRDGIYESDPQDSVARIKRAVRNNLRTLDPTAKIEETHYFNHTYSPDFVLRWSKTDYRPVYLKFGDDPEFFAEEVRIVSETQPMVVELTEPAAEAVPLNDLAVNDLAKSTNTFVADPDGMATLSLAQTDNPILRLLDRALIQGGRGVIDQARATETNAEVLLGIEAAQRLDADPTRQATTRLEQVLGGVPQGRMTRFLQALWFSSGGSESTYPGKVQLSGALDNDALAFLIETEGVAEADEFWRRIGRALTVEQIAQMPLGASYFANLQRLINANLDHLWARAIRLANQGGQTAWDDAAVSHWWVIRAGKLAFHSPSFDAYVGTKKGELEDLEVSANRPTASDLLERARRRSIPVQQLALLDPSGTVASFHHVDDSNIVSDETVRRMADSMGGEALAESVVITMPGAISVTADFEKRLASTNGPARVPLRDLVLSSSGILENLDDQDWQALVAAIPPPPREPDLFDSLQDEDWDGAAGGAVGGGKASASKVREPEPPAAAYEPKEADDEDGESLF